MGRHLGPPSIMLAIGVREIALWLQNDITREEAIVSGQQATRRYAKRQYTWFAHQPPEDWPKFHDMLDGQSTEAALALLRMKLLSGGHETLRKSDIDMGLLADKRVAILGYGNQGRAQALNLKDSGIEVVVGLRGASGVHRTPKMPAFEIALVEDAAASADIVMFLAPDEALAAL